MHTVFTVYEHRIRVANIVVDKVALNQEVLAQLPPPHLRVPIGKLRPNSARHKVCFSYHAGSVRVICVPHLMFTIINVIVATNPRVEKCHGAMKRLKVSSSQYSMEGRKIQDTLGQG